MGSLDSFILKGDRVLLDRIIETMAGGIHLPDTPKGNDRTDQFKVLKVGDKVESPLIKVGSVVYAAGYSQFVKKGNKPIYIVREEGILAVVE